MAPAAKAKPNEHEFDADARAKAREDAAITLGGKVFRRRRKTIQVTEEMRKLMRREGRARDRVRRLGEQIAELPLDAPEADLDQLEGQEEEAIVAADLALYELLALLLRDEDHESPSVDHLREHLDVQDARPLAEALAGGGEPVEGPTPATGS